MRNLLFFLISFFCAVSLSYAAENKDILPSIIEESKKSTDAMISSLTEQADAPQSAWIKGVNYLGNCQIDKKNVHVAILTFNSSAPANSKTPHVPVEKHFVAFFDGDLKLRGWWYWPFYTDKLSLSNHQLFYREQIVVDFEKNKSPTFFFENRQFRIPRW